MPTALDLTAWPFSSASMPRAWFTWSHVRSALPVRFVPSETAIWPASAPFVMPEPVSGARSAVLVGVSTAISWPWNRSLREGAEPVTVYAARVSSNSGGSLTGNSITPPPDEAVAVGQDRAGAVDRDAHQATIQPRSA
jgi:hypothetical protein